MYPHSPYFTRVFATGLQNHLLTTIPGSNPLREPGPTARPSADRQQNFETSSDREEEDALDSNGSGKEEVRGHQSEVASESCLSRNQSMSSNVHPSLGGVLNFRDTTNEYNYGITWNGTLLFSTPVGVVTVT